jgi:hypothetical protein
VVQAAEQDAQPVEAEVDQSGMQALESSGDFFDDVVHAAA